MDHTPNTRAVKVSTRPTCNGIRCQTTVAKAVQTLQQSQVMSVKVSATITLTSSWVNKTTKPREGTTWQQQQLTWMHSSSSSLLAWVQMTQAGEFTMPKKSRSSTYNSLVPTDHPQTVSLNLVREVNRHRFKGSSHQDSDCHHVTNCNWKWANNQD